MPRLSTLDPATRKLWRGVGREVDPGGADRRLDAPTSGSLVGDSRVAWTRG